MALIILSKCGLFFLIKSSKWLSHCWNWKFRLFSIMKLSKWWSSGCCCCCGSRGLEYLAAATEADIWASDGADVVGGEEVFTLSVEMRHKSILSPKKLQSKTEISKKVHKTLLSKKLLEKCWWNLPPETLLLLTCCLFEDFLSANWFIHLCQIGQKGQT